MGVSVLWLMPAIAFVLLCAVAVVGLKHLMTELRAAGEALDVAKRAAKSVREDLRRTRAALDALDLPDLRKQAGLRTARWIARWAIRRFLP